MIGILIIAHGHYGESLLNSAQHVLGNIPQQCETITFSSQDEMEQLQLKAQQLTVSLNSGQGVIILSDMYGATPCNMVTNLLSANDIEAVAGVNLPMLLRTITYRNLPLAELVEKAVSGGREGVVHFNQNQCKRYEQE